MPHLDNVYRLVGSDELPAPSIWRLFVGVDCDSLLGYWFVDHLVISW